MKISVKNIEDMAALMESKKLSNILITIVLVLATNLNNNFEDMQSDVKEVIQKSDRNEIMIDVLKNYHSNKPKEEI